MAKRIIIHAGFHKTGTTALQRSFAAARAELLKHDVSYPGDWWRSHHKQVWSLRNRAWGWSSRGATRLPISHWKTLVRDTRRQRQTTLLSSEFFAQLPLDKIQRIKNDFAGQPVEIVFTIRPMVSLLPSIYQQYLKFGLREDYDSWLHQMFDAPGESKVTPTFWKRHPQSAVIEKWAEVFGVENIKVVVADERNPSFLIDSFNNENRLT